MLCAKNVYFSYSYPDSLFTDLSVRLELGRVCGLLGRNGAGKTTLLKLLCGLLFPHGGEVLQEGRAVGFRAAHVLREVVYVPEDTWLPAVSLSDYVRVTAPFYPRFSDAVLRRALRDLAVSSQTRCLSTLSHGQRRKFAFAFALACGARFTLLDEPTNGMDLESQAAMRQLLLAHAGPERTFVVSSHHVREFENVLDYLVILHDARVVLSGFIEEIFARSGSRDLEAVYLQVVQGEGGRDE